MHANMPAGMRGSFSHEVGVPLPKQDRREQLVHALIAGPVPHQGVPGVASQGTDGGAGRGEDDAAWMARQCAGCSPGDIAALVSRASAQALLRQMAGGGGGMGRGRVTRADLAEALQALKAQSASAIGAPKVPNVKWSDVGGLEQVMRVLKSIPTSIDPSIHPSTCVCARARASACICVFIHLCACVNRMCM